MSGPENGRGRDAFDDFFGDPTPSGRMGPAEHEQPDAEGEVTRDIDLGRDAGTPTAPAPHEATQPAATPTGGVPDDWWTSDAEPTTAAPADPTWQAAPVPPPAAAPTQYAQPQERAPRRGVSPLALVALLLGGVLLGGLCVGGVVMALDQEEDEPVATETTVTETSSPTPSDPTTSSTSSTTSSTSSSSSSSSPTRSGELPAGVRSCAGPKDGVAVGRGTEVTSCDFAVAVREAYLAESSSGSVSLEVRSPVTKKDYTMSCSGQVVTRCTGGNDAVVVLY